MSARFTLDLLHPGHVADSWQDWFIGPQGGRRLLIAAGICAGIILLVVIVLVLPPTFRLSTDQGAIPRLRADLGTREGNLNLLRQDLQALGVEAKRQVRWADLLNAFRHQTPPTIKLQKVEAGVAPAPPAPPPGQTLAQGIVPTGGELKIEAVTPLRPGPPPLLEIATFMGGLLKDPAVERRYRLKSWELKQAGGGGGAGPGDGPQLQILITLSEKPR
jgi:hypothetical protein